MQSDVHVCRCAAARSICSSAAAKVTLLFFPRSFLAFAQAFRFPFRRRFALMRAIVFGRPSARTPSFGHIWQQMPISRQHKDAWAIGPIHHNRLLERACCSFWRLEHQQRRTCELLSFFAGNDKTLREVNGFFFLCSSYFFPLFLFHRCVRLTSMICIFQTGLNFLRVNDFPGCTQAVVRFYIYTHGFSDANGIG